jgi:hypothetical protein
MQQKADDTATPAPAVEAARLAYSIESFAKAADIGRTTVYEAIRTGRLKAKKVGSRTIITTPAARDYLDALPDMAA